MWGFIPEVLAGPLQLRSVAACLNHDAIRRQYVCCSHRTAVTSLPKLSSRLLLALLLLLMLLSPASHAYSLSWRPTYSTGTREYHDLVIPQSPSAYLLDRPARTYITSKTSKLITTRMDANRPPAPKPYYSYYNPKPRSDNMLFPDRELQKAQPLPTRSKETN
ncbi:hypothetical protein CAPTEDRAFT_194821 [Capitella teleta]|uniref:Uncharacterized protein n=1 Tax=Capitella teleta TaxID=283909 RepID=R7UT92_CAPTE|nr:hypothetical protein CAPTEDRAFT_194821 [Capitella teleta]|eukprot:ELU09388.1 hypothetical protein CAPTEDRAFT_194821 [Capitella teleta]